MKKKQPLIPYRSLLVALLLCMSCKDDDTLVTGYKDFSIYLPFDSLPHAPLDISKSVLQKKSPGGRLALTTVSGPPYEVAAGRRLGQ